MPNGAVAFWVKSRKARAVLALFLVLEERSEGNRRLQGGGLRARFAGELDGPADAVGDRVLVQAEPAGRAGVTLSLLEEDPERHEQPPGGVVAAGERAQGGSGHVAGSADVPGEEVGDHHVLIRG